MTVGVIYRQTDYTRGGWG